MGGVEAWAGEVDPSICVVTEDGMKKLAWLLISPLIATPLCAADLMQVYRGMPDNDRLSPLPAIRSKAGQEKQPQARAGLLPSLSLSGNTVWNENDQISAQAVRRFPNPLNGNS